MGKIYNHTTKREQFQIIFETKDYIPNKEIIKIFKPITMKTLLLKLYNWIMIKVYNDEEFNRQKDKFLKEHE